MILSKAVVAVLLNAPRAWFSRLLRTREVVKALETNQAAILATTPVNGWPLAIQQHQERIQAVRDGKLDIVDRRSWAYPYLPECASEDTEILTRRGWLKMPEVDLTDWFATRHSDGTFQWQKATHLHKSFYRGKMVKIETLGVNLLVTPNHRMLGRKQFKSRDVSYAKNKGPLEFVRAEDLLGMDETQTGYGWKKFCIPLTSRWTAGETPGRYVYFAATAPSKYSHAKRYKVCLADWVAFLGLYLAEGSSTGALSGIDENHTASKPYYVQAIAASAEQKSLVETRQNEIVSGLSHKPRKAGCRLRQFGHRFGVSISQTKTSSKREIRALLRRMPFKFWEGPTGFTIASKALWEAVSPLGNSYTKAVPDWVKNLPARYLKIFAYWAVLGDGYYDRAGYASYCTVSRRLADDIQEIFQKLGFAVNLGTKNNTKRNKRWAPAFSVRTLRRQYAGIERPELVDYAGFVFCPSVPNGTVLLRRAGVSSWCGNSLHRLNQPILKNTPYNLRRFSETPIPRRAINLIKNAVASLRWDVVATEDSSTAKDLERDSRASIAKACLNRPNNVDSWRTLIEAVTEDIIIGGYGCIEPRMTPNPRRPFKLWAVDGSTIRIFADWTEGTPDKPRYAQMTGLKGERGIIPFLSDEIIYIKDNPRTNTPFGLGKLEVCFNTVNAFLGIQDMSAKAGADQVHKTWLWWKQPLAPGNHQLIQQHLFNEAEGQSKISMMSGLPVPEVLDVRAVTSEDLLLDWQEFLIRILASGFDLSPLSLGLERDVNRNTGQIMAQADFRSGVYPMAVRVQDHLTRDVLHGYMRWRDLRFTFLGLEDADPITRSGIERVKYQANAITPDEIRAADGNPPLPGGWGKLTFGMMQIVTAIATARIQKQYGTAPKPFGGGPGGQQQPGGGGPPGLGDGGSSSPFASLTPQPSGIFSAADIAQMQPNEIEMYRDSGMLPRDTETMVRQMEEEQPGILEALSDELREYFEAQMEKERAEKRKDAKLRQKKGVGSEAEQKKKYRERESSVSEQERRFFDRGYSPRRPVNYTPRSRTGHT